MTKEEAGSDDDEEDDDDEEEEEEEDDVEEGTPLPPHCISVIVRLLGVLLAPPFAAA